MEEQINMKSYLIIFLLGILGLTLGNCTQRKLTAVGPKPGTAYLTKRHFGMFTSPGWVQLCDSNNTEITCKTVNVKMDKHNEK